MRRLKLQEDGAIDLHDNNNKVGVANDNFDGIAQASTISDATDINIDELCKEDSTDVHKAKQSCPIFSKNKCCKIFIVFLMCCIVFSTYVLLELPVGMAKTIIEVMQLTTTQYNVLYSLFFLPTILLAPVGGLITDKFRAERSLPMFLLSCCLGQILLSIGSFLGHYWLMIVGRVLTGAGGMVFVCLSSYIASFFTRHINLMNGILLGTARLGATLSVNLNSQFYSSLSSHATNHHTRLGIVLLLSVVLILIAFICSLLLWYTRRYVKPALYKRRSVTCNYRNWSCPSLYFVVLALVAGVFYAAVLTPTSVGELYYMHKYRISLAISNLINSFVHILPVFLCPLFGLIINQVGYNPVWILIAVLTGTLSHFLLAYSNDSQSYAYIGSFIGGASYSMFTSSIWPMVSLIVKPEFIGLGYGIQQAVISCFQVLVASTVGSVADNYGYFMVQLYYIALSMISLSLVLLLNMIDYTSHREKRVNMSKTKRKLRNKEKL